MQINRATIFLAMASLFPSAIAAAQTTPARGEARWAEAIGGSTFRTTRAAVDGAGTTAFALPVSSGLSILGQVSDGYLLLFDDGGNLVWHKRYTTDDGAVIEALARGPNGDIFVWAVAGELNQTGVDVGCGAPGTRRALSRLTKDGDCVWTHPVVTSPPQQQGNQPPLEGFGIEGLATDAAGNIVLTGQFLDFVDFGNGRLETAPDFDKEVVAELLPSGAVRWTHTIAGRINLANPSLATTGEVFISGSFAGTLTDLGPPLTSTNGAAVVARLRPTDGQTTWAQAFDGASAGAMTVSATSSRVVVAGDFLGTVHFGPKTFTSPPNAFSGYILEVAPDGSFRAATALPSTMPSIAFAGVTIDAQGGVTVGMDIGLEAGSVTIGSQTFAVDNGDNLFAAQFGPDLSRTNWVRRYTQNGSSGSIWLAQSDGNRLVVTGTFAPTITLSSSLTFNTPGRTSLEAFIASLVP